MPITLKFEEFKKINKERALAIKKAADDGDTNAQCNFAFCCQYGYGVDKQQYLAQRYWGWAAGKNDTDALIQLGFIFLNNGDRTNASKNFEKVVQLGLAQAQYGLARCYFDHQDEAYYVQAACYFKMAALQGHADAKYYYSLMLREGLGGIKKDERMADRLLYAAFEAGSRVALPHIIANRKSPPDLARSFESRYKDNSVFGDIKRDEGTKFQERWQELVEAVNERDRYALNLLGIHYVEQTIESPYQFDLSDKKSQLEEGITLIEYAVLLGHVSAMFNYAQYLKRGIAIRPQNILMALSILQLAASHGHTIAQEKYNELRKLKQWIENKTGQVVTSLDYLQFDIYRNQMELEFETRSKATLPDKIPISQALPILSFSSIEREIPSSLPRLGHKRKMVSSPAVQHETKGPCETINVVDVSLSSSATKTSAFSPLLKSLSTKKQPSGCSVSTEGGVATVVSFGQRSNRLHQ